MSERHEIAERIATFIRENDMNCPFGGDVILSRAGKMPCYTTAFSLPQILDGIVSVYSPKFIQVRFQTAIRDLPSSMSLVFKTEKNALRFLELAFIKHEFDAAMAIPTMLRSGQ